MSVCLLWRRIERKQPKEMLEADSALLLNQWSARPVCRPFRQTGETILAPQHLRCVVPNGAFRVSTRHEARCVKALPRNPSLTAEQLTAEPRPNSTTPGLCFTSPERGYYKKGGNHERRICYVRSRRDRKCHREYPVQSGQGRART